MIKDQKETNIKYAKITYLRALASKKLGLDKAVERFQESLVDFVQTLKSDKNFHISQIYLEIGEIKKK